ncbi:GTP-binding nuclear protein Ran-like [Drosophila obscura]|uniref:GTP-binding nuclear protein Ran-like n=1 Tax=Drosophila obscura TaxID=7282 RepID=UPI001BB185E3|nr:GTP-binding nuclear protein Ran-like [Drosophila obscura]
MFKPTFKLVLVGDAQTGKTSLIKRHLNGTFDEFYVPTVGHDIQTLEFRTKRGPVWFTVWDTAGQPRHEGLRDICYTGSHCAIIMFDVTTTASYERVAYWHRELLATCGTIPIVMCGNKSEIIKDREVFKWQSQYFDISVKNNYGCKTPFCRLFYQLIGERFKYCAIVRPHLKMIQEHDENQEAAEMEMEVDKEEQKIPEVQNEVKPMEIDEVWRSISIPISVAMIEKKEMEDMRMEIDGEEF